MIPWYYRAGAVLILLAGIFGLGYWRGDRHGAKALGECEATVKTAEAATAEQGRRLDALNMQLAAIGKAQADAVAAAKAAQDAAHTAGRAAQAAARALPGTDCQTTADAARALAPSLSAQWRPAK